MRVKSRHTWSDPQVLHWFFPTPLVLPSPKYADGMRKCISLEPKCVSGHPCWANTHVKVPFIHSLLFKEAFEKQFFFLWLHLQCFTWFLSSVTFWSYQLCYNSFFLSTPIPHVSFGMTEIALWQRIVYLLCLKKKRACPPAAGFKNALKLVILHKALCWNVIYGMSFVTHIAKYVQTKISRMAQCSAKSLWKLYFQNKSDHFRYFQRTGVKLIGSRLEFSCSAPNTSLLRQ